MLGLVDTCRRLMVPALLLSFLSSTGCEPASPPERGTEEATPVPIAADDESDAGTQAAADDVVGRDGKQPAEADRKKAAEDDAKKADKGTDRKAAAGDVKPEPMRDSSEVDSTPDPVAKAKADAAEPSKPIEPADSGPDIGAPRASADTGAKPTELSPPAMKTEPAVVDPPAEVAETTQVPQEAAPPMPDVETLFEPKVVLSDEHAAMSVLQLGDTMPDLQLTDLEGNARNLTQLLGQKLTLVIFWSTREALGRDQFKRLEQEAVRRFRDYGVATVAVNVGDPVETVQRLYEEAAGRFACLHDKDQSALAQVAEGKLPRTYLLDSEGRILWFDLEYSRGTRRELNNAVYFHLRKAGG